MRCSGSAAGRRLGAGRLPRAQHWPQARHQPPRGSRNLRRALPEISQAQGRVVICSLWDNLGPVMAEYPHLGKDHAYVEAASRCTGAQNIRAREAPGKRAIFFSGHFGNWAVATRAVTRGGSRCRRDVPRRQQPDRRSAPEPFSPA
jgi:lauroyl/myristoyl acyltransferase